MYKADAKLSLIAIDADFYKLLTVDLSVAISHEINFFAWRFRKFPMETCISAGELIPQACEATRKVIFH